MYNKPTSVSYTDAGFNKFFSRSISSTDSNSLQQIAKDANADKDNLDQRSASSLLGDRSIIVGDNPSAGGNGVIVDIEGVRGYSGILGETFNLPTDGSAPTFSSGVINSSIIELNTNAIVRTSETVGDGGTDAHGLLINNTGLYGAANGQSLTNANVRILADGSAYFNGEVTAGSGDIGGWNIGGTTLTDDSGAVGMSSDVTAGDDIRFWAGHTTPTSAPFKVTESGKLTATDATIAGNITIGNPEDINASDITNDENWTDDTTANAKNKTFTSTPTVPYKVGDLWTGLSAADLKVCTAQRLTGSYTAGDWVLATKYTDDTALNTFVEDTYVVDIASLQNQIDGVVANWFYEGVPTLINAPAVSWDTAQLLIDHEGDLYYDLLTGYAYRFVLSGGNYVWYLVPDAGVAAALEAASTAQDTADGKRRVFVVTPFVPYDIGDLWAAGSTGDLKKCVTAKTSAGSYSLADWELATKYTDDTVANQALTDAGQAISDAADAQGTADGKVTTFFDASIPTSEAIGDLWIHTDDDNKLYRAASIGANEIKVGEWILVQDAGIGDAIAAAGDAQSTADGKIITFYANSAPTATSIGDLWFDLDDKNKLYRASAAGNANWVAVRDTDIAQAIQDASDAQGAAEDAQTTADAKIQTYYQSAIPLTEYTNTPNNATYNNLVGDMWYDTDTAQTWRYSKVANGGNFDYKFLEMEIPVSVFDTIDGKRTVFTATPTVPYYVGDLWLTSLTATTGDLKKCITERLTGSYTATEWVVATKYTDDTVANGKITAGGAAADINANVTTISGGKITTHSIAADALEVGVITATESITVGTTNKIWLNDSSDGHIAVGGSTKASAPFNVSETGALLATSATITGAITAATGSVIATGYLDGAVALANTDIAAKGWSQTCAFAPTSESLTQVEWSAGTFNTADGLIYTIAVGNTGVMAERTYIYFDMNSLVGGETDYDYQVTIFPQVAVGAGKVLIGTAINGDPEPIFQIFGGVGGLNIPGTSIVANSITGNEVAFNTLTGQHMDVATLDAISANMGSITGGTVTLDTAGHIKGGMTDFNTGIGFFLGIPVGGGSPVFSIGNSDPDEPELTWDNTTLAIKGKFTTTTPLNIKAYANNNLPGVPVDTYTYSPSANANT